MSPLWIFAGLFGVTYIANNAPAARVLARRLGPRAVASGLGWLQFGHHLGGAAGVAAGGASVSAIGDYRLALAASVAFALVGVGASAVLPRTRSAREVATAPRE